MGLDFGTVRTGVAFADAAVALPSPHSVVRGDARARVAQVAALARAENVVGIVLGLPLSLTGEEGAAARRVRRFAAELQAALPDIELHFQDERFSSKVIESTRSKRSAKQDVDAAAAAWLLQSFLEARERGGDSP